MGTKNVRKSNKERTPTVRSRFKKKLGLFER